MKCFSLFLLIFIALFLSLECSKDKSTITSYETHNPPDSIAVRKPNIYIYPVEQINLKVEISFPFGGRIITSEPTYTSSGWEITVDTTGLINNAYQYLFYECKIPNHFQTSEGWNVSQKNLDVFFKESLNQFGLNEEEIQDFQEYWLPQLTDFEYYLIFPQKMEIINKLIGLHVSIEPQNLQRIFYLFEGTNKSTDVKMIPPQYNTIDRSGYTIIEWGGIIHD